MSLFLRAQAIVSLTARKVTGEPVTYKRGSAFSLPIELATQGRTRWQMRDTQGMIVVTESVDWLIEFDALDFEPVKFDKIEAMHAHVVRSSQTSAAIYQVMPFGPEGRCWRWHGNDRTTIRIYTKLLSDPGVTP